MSDKNKVYHRNLEEEIFSLIEKQQSCLLLGPRQTGKTTMLESCLRRYSEVERYLLQNPRTRRDFEIDPALLIRQVEAFFERRIIFIDEGQKVPELFDSIQYLIDKHHGPFIITGSSARKLRRQGVNLLPGRVRLLRMDPLSWNELSLMKEHRIECLTMHNLPTSGNNYSLEQSLIFGSLPGIVTQTSDQDRIGGLNSYTDIYLEEEIRAEALSRKIGSFSRFLELAAIESGTAPNLNKLAMATGVTAPSVKEFYSILEDTLVVERLDPFIKYARKRLFATPRYYFFDTGVRNSLARLPLTKDILQVEKGRLFEHAVVLEIIRRIRAKHLRYTVHYWRTQNGAEVDCVIDTGTTIIPIEIKASEKVSLQSLSGLKIFLEDYSEHAPHGYVITMAERPEKLAENITAIPWNYL